MNRVGAALLYGVIGYAIAAVIGYAIVGQFSSNMHDRAVEAAMTGAFVTGPIGAVVAAVVGFVRVGRTQRSRDSSARP